MNELIFAIEKSIKLLNYSDDFVWANRTESEIKEFLNNQLTKIKNGESFDKLELKILFAPTADMQELSLSNGWADEYLEIAEIIDKFAN